MEKIWFDKVKHMSGEKKKVTLNFTCGDDLSYCEQVGRQLELLQFAKSFARHPIQKEGHLLYSSYVKRKNVVIDLQTWPKVNLLFGVNAQGA